MSIECEICGKVFNDTPKGYKAHWYYKAHKKNCFTKYKKKQRRFIKEYSQNATDIEINRLYQFIKNPKLSPTPSPTTTPSPSSSSSSSSITMNIDEEDLERPESNTSNYSTSSECDEWKYDNINYLVDNKNRVSDEYGNYIGKRYKDNWEVWRIEYI